ncbi:MAG: C13 family peptidase [Burkholderiales bacterium]
MINTRNALPIAVLALLCLLGSDIAHAQTPDATTADGGRYFGPLVNGRMHGQGRLEWDGGEVYEGGFVNGRFSGRGRWQSAYGDVYEGEYANGAKSGVGKFTRRDGSVYVGEFRADEMNGRGHYEMPGGDVYDGQFRDGMFDGDGTYARRTDTYRGSFKFGMFEGIGELVLANGSRYRGEFARGLFAGKGVFEYPTGDRYEGDFRDNEFTGQGVFRRADGSRFEGTFRNWQQHGPGKYLDNRGTVYEGTFVDGDLTGSVVVVRHDGARYEGEFRNWLPHGTGVMTLPNGDVYRGNFVMGQYDGPGTLTYGKPRPDGTTAATGVWARGRLQGADERGGAQARANVETALYNQRRLLDRALAAVEPRVPDRINLFLLAIGGDGTQEVFRREVEFVRNQFDADYGTRGHSVALVNSRNTVATLPMATHTSIRESLAAIARQMDKERDVLFVFLTSHGSEKHELTLDLDSLDLANVTPALLREWLQATGIRWKVIVVSACYAGGFIGPLQDERTLVIAAARHDRRSFGCADENEFTYFGRAFFKEALPATSSFAQAFAKAQALVAEWEARDRSGAAAAGAPAGATDDGPSLPQIANPPAIDAHLKLWREQLGRPAPR